jgi:hypothetical protein
MSRIPSWRSRATSSRMSGAQAAGGPEAAGIIASEPPTARTSHTQAGTHAGTHARTHARAHARMQARRHVSDAGLFGEQPEGRLSRRARHAACAAVALPRALLILLAVAHRDPDRSEPRAFVARRGSRAPERVQRACVLVYACGHSRERGRSDLEDTKPGHVWACARREKVETPREDHH